MSVNGENPQPKFANDLVERYFLNCRLFIQARRRLVTTAAIAAALSVPAWYLSAQAGAGPSGNKIGLRLIIVDSIAEAQQVMSRLRNGEDFGAIAWEKSTDTTARDGGFLGRVDPAAIRPELRNALQGLEPGQVSKIFKMGPGYSILKVLSDAEVSAIESQVRVPREDIGVEALPARKKAQMETVNQFKVFHDFRFTDKVKESGITFVHHVVDDAARNHKLAHYDHGNGIAVADVDGDGLYDVYFVNQVGGNELWKNLGAGKFKNITSEAGVGLPERISVSASFADIDNDGDQDLFVTTVLGGNVLFENDGQGHFKDITKEAGLDLVAHSSGAVFFDYNNDGLVDLLVCNVGNYTTGQIGSHGEHVARTDAFSGHLHPDRFEFPVLYKNLGHHHFKDVTAEVGLKPKGWGGDASFADLNGDGWPDLFILNMQGANHFYTNQAGRSFVDKTAQYFPKTPWGAMGLKFFDFDNDGRIDLFVTDMHSDMFEPFGPDNEKMKQRILPGPGYLGGRPDQFIFGNALYHNLGGGRFEEVSDRMGAENYWPWGPSVGDINADGWEDIFIASSMNFPLRYGINSMLLNNRGEKFLDSEFLLGIEPRRAGRTYTPWYELDCDQVALNGDKQPKYTVAPCKGRTGKITVMGTLGTRSSVIFDLDNDGDLDIVTNEFNSEPQVLISDLAQRKRIHWLKIALTGTASNRNGLGARVRVRAGGQVYTKYNDGKSGYLSQSALPLYFGLAEASKIDRVEIDWPSGRKQIVTQGLHANSTLRVTEPK